MIKKLLIIGNGFDLYCNLPTKFVDYYNYKKDLNPIYNDFLSIYRQFDININNVDNMFLSFMNQYKNIILSQISIWDLYFFAINQNEEDVNWYNIEKQMLNSLRGDIKEPSFWERVLYLLDDMSLHINGDVFKSASIIERLIYMTLKYMHCEKISPNTFFRDDSLKIKELKFIKDNWQYFLFEQMKILELDFKKYIIIVQNSNILYPKNQKDTFKRLLGVFDNAYLMSFNYTLVNKNNLFESVENVHGLASEKGEIIFGIDNSSCNPGDFNYVFTKTYRKVSMYITTPLKVINEVLKKDINQIVFFGHSLNEQDYSYFQTIFDYFDLYNSQIKLEFFYYIYDKNKRIQIENNFISGVISLLDNYGKTLDNKHKGRNLIHKLLNESRLIIKLI